MKLHNIQNISRRVKSLCNGFLMAGFQLFPTLAMAQAPFPGDLHAWFKSDAGVSTESNAVTQWADQSGNGFVLTPPATGPVLNPGVLNGLPALTFDGSTQLNGDLTAPAVTGASIFAIFRYTIEDSNNDYLYTLGSDGPAGSQFTLSRRSDSSVYHFDGGAQNVGEDGTLPPNTWFVSSQVFGADAGISHNLFLNSVSVQRTSASDPYSADLSTSVVGNWTGGSNRFVGDLVELLVYDRALTVSERSDVEEYLRERAGLPEFFKTEAEVLADWSVIQYELSTQPDAEWTFDLGGTRADQATNADASILLSEIDVADKVIWGQFGSGSAPDFMGFVFGYQNTREFYLFDWKKETASFLNFGQASAGMRLTTFHMDGEEPSGRDFWASDRAEHTTVLLQNNIPWVDGVDYDFSIVFSPGSFTIRVWEGETVLESWTVSDSTYPSGRFGYFSNSLQNVRYGQVFANDIGPLEIDMFEVDSGQVAMRWLGGEPPYVIESDEDLDSFTPATNHIWNRTTTLPQVGDRGFFRVRSIGTELSSAP